MRQLIHLGLFVLIAGCDKNPNHIGNPLILPISALTNGIGNATYQQRRGKVEVIVKANFSDILEDIAQGNGATLTEAMDASGIKYADRPARILQMQRDLELYRSNPEALVVALMVYGS